MAPTKSKKSTSGPAKKRYAQYEVEKIVDKKVENGEVHYKIRWKGYTSDDDKWVPLEHTKCRKLIDAYEMRLLMREIRKSN